MPILLPPTANGRNTDRRTLRQFRRRSVPIVGVNRTNVPYPGEVPIIGVAAYRWEALLFCHGGLVDPPPKFTHGFERPLHFEAEGVRRVAVPAHPAALAGIRLHKIGQRDSELNLSFAQRFQFRSWPRKLMQVHVAGLDAAAIVPQRL